MRWIGRLALWGALCTAPTAWAESPDSARLGADLTKAYRSGDFEEAAKLLINVKIAAEASSSVVADLPRMQTRLSLLGKPMPSLDGVTWYQGDAEFGKDAAIVFFETWCPHCRREVPAMPARMDKHNVDLLFLTKASRTSSDDAVRAFIEEHHLQAPVGREDGAVSLATGVHGVPSAVYLKKGVVVWHGHPARLNAKLIARLQDTSIKKLIGDVPKLMDKAAALPMPRATGTGAVAGVPGADVEKSLATAREAVKNLEYLEATDSIRQVLASPDAGRMSSYARRMLAELKPIGSTVPPAEANWIQGGADLSAPTLVVFWEVWCPHCRREVPKLQAMSETYAGRMHVVGFTQLSRTSTLDGTTEFMQDNNVTYPVGVIQRSYADAFAVSGIPAAALVKEGRVVWRGHPGNIDDALVERFLAVDVDGEIFRGVPEVVALLEGLPAPERPGVDPNEKQASELHRAAREAQNANDPTLAITLLRELLDSYPESRAANYARRTLTELETVGKAAASFDSVRWIQGAAPRHTDAVYVVFFETWCPHCKRELPKLQGDLADFAAQNVAVVGLTKLTRNTDDSDANEFIEERGLEFPIGVEDRSLSDAYAITGVPAAVLLKDGAVIWRGHPGRMNKDLLAELMAR